MASETPSPFAFGFPVWVDASIPHGTVRIEAAETHLLKFLPDETAEFVGGPHDGLVVKTV